MKRIALLVALGAVLCSVMSGCAIVPLRPGYIGGGYDGGRGGYGGYGHHDGYYGR